MVSIAFSQRRVYIHVAKNEVEEKGGWIKVWLTHKSMFWGRGDQNGRGEGEGGMNVRREGEEECKLGEEKE